MKQSIEVQLYEIVDRAVEEGVGYGLNRAYKHLENPSRELIAESVAREVMNALSEVLRWE
jgi:ribosomal protein L7Ae-like RNA K-turn-binding protein